MSCHFNQLRSVQGRCILLFSSPHPVPLPPHQKHEGRNVPLICTPLSSGEEPTGEGASSGGEGMSSSATSSISSVSHPLCTTNMAVFATATDQGVWSTKSLPTNSPPNTHHTDMHLGQYSHLAPSVQYPPCTNTME